MSRAMIAAAMMILCSEAGRAEAIFDPNFTYDQVFPYDNYGRSAASSPIGESFTPTRDSLNFAAFVLSDNSQHQGGAYDVKVYQGVGTGGTLLATSGPTVLPPHFGEEYPGEVAYFYFASKVALLPGTPQTLILHKVSGDDFFVYGYIAGKDGSRAIILGQTRTDFTLAFAEGTVPEPAGLIMGGTAALIGVGYWWRRRTRFTG